VGDGPKNGAVAEHARGQSRTVEDALARAIEGAVVAGRWDVVAQLAKELEARRLESSVNVVRFPPERRG
jgi:hypothetical protein